MVCRVTCLQASAAVLLVWLGAGSAAGQSPGPNAELRSRCGHFTRPIVRPHRLARTRAQGAARRPPARRLGNRRATPAQNSERIRGTTTLPSAIVPYVQRFQSRFVPSWYSATGHCCSISTPRRSALRPHRAARAALSGPQSPFRPVDRRRASRPMVAESLARDQRRLHGRRTRLDAEARSAISRVERVFKQVSAALIAAQANRVVVVFVDDRIRAGRTDRGDLGAETHEGHARRFRPISRRRRMFDRRRPAARHARGGLRYTSASNTRIARPDTVTVRVPDRSGRGRGVCRPGSRARWRSARDSAAMCGCTWCKTPHRHSHRQA